MKKLVIFGAGGLGRECSQFISDINRIQEEYELLGFIDEDFGKKGSMQNGFPVLGGMDELGELSQKGNLFVFCAVADPILKMSIAGKIKSLELTPINIIHPTSYVVPEIMLGENVLIAPHCILTTNIVIGSFVHLNPGCAVGHDSSVGDFSTLYWNVTVSGNVSVGKCCQLGSKCFIKQGLNVEDNAILGAGAVVISDVSKNQTVVGVPAK